MTDHEKSPAGGERRRGAIEDQPPLCRGDVEIEDEDEVVRARIGLVVEEVRADKLDVDSSSRGELPSVGDRDVGEVDSGDPPTASGEPDGVPALPAREIEGGSRGEIRGFGGEGPVRLRAPHVLPVLRLGVLPIPLLTPHAASPSVRRRAASRRA